MWYKPVNGSNTMWHKPVNGSNTECYISQLMAVRQCDISQLMHAPVFQFLWVMKCLYESAAAVSSSISCVFTAVCATALAGCLQFALCNFTGRCLFEGVWCLWRIFCNISLHFKKTVSTTLNALYYYMYMMKTLNAYHHNVQLITILKSI